MTDYRREPTGRTDTMITEVAVRGNDGSSQPTAAVKYVKDTFPDQRPVVVAVYRAHLRDPAGNAVFCVEWVDGEGT